MDQAWLDSLSEDWVSQPRSAGSPVPSLPSLSNSTSSNNRASRIPTIAPTKQTVSTALESPLSERSTNDNNIPLSQRSLRRPSKLKEELSNSTRGRDTNRRLSASSTQSVVYNTVQHKSHSLSPTKSLHETPEWKKRLLQGDVAYGEQCDLFSPAGLENIFRPPPPQPTSPSKRGSNIEDGSIMPSSPPPYHVKFARPESTKATPNNEQKKNEERRHPRVMNYRLADDGSSGFSENDISQSSNFHPKPTAEIQRRGSDQHAASVSNSNMDSSSVQHDVVPGVVQRLASGQSIMLNEELSPIFISKHNTDDGKIDFAPLDVSAAELQKRLEELSVHSRNQAAEGEEGEVSQLLPGDWTTGTDDFAHNGCFVNLRRGGHSQEGSFQKRLLSSSSLPAIDESAMLPEESIQASTPKQLPIIKKTRASDGFPGTLSLELSPSSIPPAPHPSPAKPDNQSAKSGSGSPLKLFGNYDTFTNAKLLRRLSQFEEHYDNSQEEFARGISSREVEATHPEVNQAFVAPSSPEKLSYESNSHSPRRMSSFGKGDLDSFRFSEAISYESNDASLQENNESFDTDDDKENVSLPALDSNIQTKFRFQLDPSPSLEESSVRQRRAKQISTVNTARRTVTLRKIIRPDSLASGNSDTSTVIPVSERQEDLKTPRKRNGDSEGKRLQYSPVKDPTPKRRRTLPKDEFANGNVDKEILEGDSLRDTHQQMQNVISLKRNDARHENDHQAANPKVLAMRQILRPRTPTPSQRGSVQHERVPLAELTSTERTRLLQQEKIARIQAELDSNNPFKASMQNDSRKGSVTTQDFLDEAKKIMLAIRGKTRPRSGLTSVEESESETDRKVSTGTATQEQDEEDENSYQESSQEPFSRPPSRDGRPVPKVAREQQDPGVLDHLRQYEENSDMDDIIAASMRSIAMVKDAANAAEQIDRIVHKTITRTSGRLLQDDIESDPPNIRITHNPDLPRKRKHSASTASGNGDTHDGDFLSHGSTGSGSTTNSVPTGSSRGSDSRRVIAPHTVSHLIPEQLAGMVFDRERNMWVKRKSISGQGEQNFLPSDDTEEDPFGDIPDLSVDETQELQRIKAVAAKRKEEARIAHDTDVATATMPKSDEISMDISPTQVAPSKSKLETNPMLSSWSEDHGFIGKSQSTQNVYRTRITTQEETRTDFIEEVEREISIHEDRVESTSPRRRRNVTISFSSPLASVIQPAVYNDEYTPQPRPAAESGSDNDSKEDVTNSSIILNKETSNRKVSSTKTRSALRNPSRRLSVGGHTFSARPVSRIDERDEESIGKEQEEDEHNGSVSIIVTTPAPTRHEMREASVVLATPRPVSHEIGTLELTPMSEFTMNQPDESFGLEVSYIARGQRYVPGSGSKKTLSHSIKELVEKLTEVEPFEPFWEHLSKLELKEKRLTSLHKLDEFCEHLEDLDVSKNQIYQLNGAPTTIRHLRISHNCLSDLTAWGHLTNLQYVDISNNEIESLSAFKYQVHLRSLRADNNKIRSLDGIGHLDGLLSLRLRGNLVEAIDFAGTKLQRLNDLDLKNNRVREVQNLQKLTSLQSLNLEDNDLEIFPQINSVTPWSLKYLKLSGNKLNSLDVSQCPNLRLLYLDRNRLGNVTGFFACKHLDSLSMREQQEDAIIDIGFLSEAFEIRKLFLSGNLLLNFAPQVDYLNLQYLELANCGLDSLPENFGQIFSNVRVLNLNFNALRELSSLAGIVRLKKLHVTGNRLARLRKTAVELHQHSSLKSVDLRNNPISLGFYPTVTEKQLVVPSATQDVDGGTVYDPYTLGDAERAKDMKYAACLDMETKMRRRIYEILANGACRKLKFLDGLKADKTVTGVRDKVWNALVTAGVVTGELVDLGSSRKDRKQTAPKESASSRGTISDEEERGTVRPRTPDGSGVWYAEDSFA